MRPIPERSISAATNSEAIASARTSPVTRMTTPAMSVPMKAYRSVSRCWKEPSMFRLRRTPPASTNVASPLTAIPTRATMTIGHAFTCTGEMRRPIAA